MKKTFLLLACLFAGYAFAQTNYNPLPNPAAVVKEGDVRFTVLTPFLIRLEWNGNGTFIDDATFVVVNRNLRVPHFTTTKKNGWLSIVTGELELRYQLNSGQFTPQNLSIRSLHASKQFSWKPGLMQEGNLKGTCRTLDRFEGDLNMDGKTQLQLEDGILATDGWSLIDDSKSLHFDKSDWPWVKERPAGEYQDWYFMGYGLEYKKALQDYMLIAGKVPLPPRYAFGYWWSRYWSYSDNEIRDMVQNFKKYNLPLDVFVIDMDWHYTDSLGRRDEFGQQKHWTGWTWNKRLFPDPQQFLQWMKSEKLRTTLNLHPASGIAPYEAPYSEFARKLKFDTTGKKSIPYLASDKTFMKTLFEVVLHPMEKQGVDFWWLDWQQWLNDKKITDLSNTWWLNYTFFTDKERNSNERPMLYHRWGGLGNHRYQIGFSGDVVVSWKSLAYQPYFTSTASNVLYGYWSHDIGGHMFAPNGSKVLDPELYVRWMQFGALSPIFRTHSAKTSNLNKEAWNFAGEYYDALSNAIHLRYQLAPYIYTMARKTYDEGLSLCRPLHYDYPASKEAYSNSSQYMFGDNMMVAPIVSAMKDSVSKLPVWLPEGNDWYEWQTGTLLKGGQTTERRFSLDEYPLYIKAGAVIPMYPAVKNLDEDPGQTIIGVFPGADGATRVYEDAGNSKDYATQYASTRVVSKHGPGRTQTITIFPREGSYRGMPAKRTYAIQLYGAEMPQKVKVNGVTLNYSSLPGKNEWSYDGKLLSVHIPLPKMQVAQKQTVVIYYSKTDSMNVNTGLVKTFRQLSKGITALKEKAPHIILPEVVGKCEETNLRLQYYPASFYETLRYFQANYSEIPSELRKRTTAANVDWFKGYMKME